MATITSVTGTALDWHTPATWIGGVVPTLGDTAVIPSGSDILAEQDPEFENSSIECDAILIEAGGLLVITAFYVTFPITVHGSITLDGGSLLNTGSLVLEAGAVAHKGTGYEQMEGVIVAKAGSTLTIDGGMFYAGVLRIAGEVTFSDNFFDFSWSAIVELGGVLTFHGGYVINAGIVVEKGGELNLLGGNYTLLNLTIDGTVLLGEDLATELGWIIVHSGGLLTVESLASYYRMLSTYEGAVIVGEENLSSFVRHEIDQIKSHDLPAESDVRAEVDYAGGELTGTLGGGTVTITVE